jgi:hypothetical protein
MNDLDAVSVVMLVPLAETVDGDLTKRPSINKTREKFVKQEEEPARRGRRQREHPHQLVSYFCLMKSDEWRLILRHWTGRTRI